MGRDLNGKNCVKEEIMFQSTRPHGARPTVWRAANGKALSFNPRARMGRDVNQVSTCRKSDEFQSTRPHGARQSPAARALTSAAVSIHAPAWGATKGKPKTLNFIRVSIHAPAWGATNRACAPETSPVLFQSTRPHGARQRANHKFVPCQ